MKYSSRFPFPEKAVLSMYLAKKPCHVAFAWHLTTSQEDLEFLDNLNVRIWLPKLYNSLYSFIVGEYWQLY